ncbi:MAG: tetratricopeptide repeat protein, partial [Sulfurimonas sp.]
IIRNLELFYYFVALAIITFLLSVTTLKRFIILFLLLFGVHLNADKNFNKAVEFYRAGEYEKALENFESIKSGDSEIKSIIYYNIGNSLVRLKEFEKAREAYLKSLTLEYSKEADENLEYIIDAGEEKKMNQGKDKKNEKSSLSEKQSAQKKQKEGGGSNMQVSVATSGASDDKGKKTEMRNSINLNSGKAKLSFKQYELINKRSVDEKKPW